jgi:hypothetical protein
MIKNKYLTQIEDTLNLYFGKKAPPIPENIKEFIVKYSPYLIVLILVLTLPGILMAFGLSSLFAPLALIGGTRRIFHFSFWALFSIIPLVLEIIALPGLFKRSKMSWEYMFYASLITALISVLSLNLGSIISAAFSFYILFQIKTYYKN